MRRNQYRKIVAINTTEFRNTEQNTLPVSSISNHHNFKLYNKFIMLFQKYSFFFFNNTKFSTICV